MRLRIEKMKSDFFYFLLIWSFFSVVHAAHLVLENNFEAAFQGKCGPSSPCVQLCVELHDGTFECECRSGYRLLLDGYSCIEATNKTFYEYTSDESWDESSIKRLAKADVKHESQRDVKDPKTSTTQSSRDDLEFDDDEIDDEDDDEEFDSKLNTANFLQIESHESNTSNITNESKDSSSFSSGDVEGKNSSSTSATSATVVECEVQCVRGVCGRDENSQGEYRCLCPMGYGGNLCEIDESSDRVGGYTSGLFRGQSWVAFPVLHDAYMSDQISLEFRPESPNGILLLTGERDDLSGDFLALFIKDSFLEFRFDCGSGSGFVRSPRPVWLQKWNRVNILRRRWDGWMQLNEGPFTQGRSKGLFSRITFRQPVFIGGAGNISLTFPIGSNGNGTGGAVGFEQIATPTGPPFESEDSHESPSSPTEPPPSKDSTDSPPTPQEDQQTTDALGIMRNIKGFRGCIKNIVINDRPYRFGLSDAENGGDALMGIDIENCNEQGVCDLLACQHGGQCVVQKEDTPTCLCPLGYSGNLCETPLDLQIPSFNGSSYLKYSGLGLSRVLSWLELEIVLKVDGLDGLILYNGYRTDGVGDFIALYIDQGHLEFTMDLGTGTATIRSEATLSLGEWHRVIVSRTGRLISMRIDNQSPLMSLTPGAFTQLSLPHNLFLGGIPDTDWLSPKVKIHGGFSGCIQKLVINEKAVRIMGSAMSGVNLENCAHPCLRNPCDHGGECVPLLETFKCHCPLGFRDQYCGSRMDKQDVLTAPRFIGDSYLHFTSPRIIKRISGSRLNLSFRVKTSSSRGLLLWAGRKLMSPSSDFLSVGLRGGFLYAAFSLGSGQISITYNVTQIFDGLWHLVTLIRNEQEARLSVDNGPPVIGIAPGKLRQLNINGGLYLGGLEDARHQSLNRYADGLVGCLADLTLGPDFRVSLLQDASEGRNVDYCD